MRAFVVAGLVVFHSAVVFASGISWFVNDPNPSPGFTVFLLWGSLWGMPLLFLVSGMGARYALRSRSAGAFIRERLGRLLVPLLMGLVVLVATLALLAAAVPVMAVEAALGPDKNTGGWERLTYLFFFLYGYLLASDRRFEQTLRRLRWWALGCAMLASVLLAMAAKVLDPSGADVVSGISPPVSAAQGLAGWMWTAAILGFAGTVAARLTTARPAGSPAGSPASTPRWRRVAHYGNEAVLPFYVLHEPVIVAVAWVIVRWPAPLLVKYLSVVAASFLLTLALYEGLVRRFQLARLLFGMKPAHPLGPNAHETRPIPAAAAATPTGGQ
jgi:hypothetical protein